MSSVSMASGMMVLLVSRQAVLAHQLCYVCR